MKTNTPDYTKRIEMQKAGNPFLSQTDLVYALLLEDILEGLRLPGSRINQEELSNALKVSRSPIREAFLRLADEKLVVQRGGKGYHVYIPNMKDAKRIAEFRQAIEIEAGILALKRISEKSLRRLQENIAELRACHESDVRSMILLDTEFHNVIVESSGNEYLIGAYHCHDHFLRHLRNSTVKGSMRDPLASTHENIYLAVADKDEERVKRLLRTHLEANVDDIIDAGDYYYR